MVVINDRPEADETAVVDRFPGASRRRRVSSATSICMIAFWARTTALDANGSFLPIRLVFTATPSLVRPRVTRARRQTRRKKASSGGTSNPIRLFAAPLSNGMAQLKFLGFS